MLGSSENEPQESNSLNRIFDSRAATRNRAKRTGPQAPKARVPGTSTDSWMS